MNDTYFNYKEILDDAVKKFSLHSDWSKKTLECTKLLTDQKKPHINKNRKNLKDKCFITVDGEDAKDFDDAVFCEINETGWVLYVAIADVSHYIKYNSPIDIDAKKRGFSVYFPNFVIPMLPEILSNNLCSLRENEDKNVVVAKINISKNGRFDKFSFFEGVIQSKARLTYDQANAVIKNKKNLKNIEIKKNILNLHSLSKVLLKNRGKRNAVEFESSDMKFQFDDYEIVKNVVFNFRLESHKIIEECMILANIACSMYIKENNKECLYRVHNKPDHKKIEELYVDLKNLGYKISKEQILKTSDINRVLKKAKENNESQLISSLILRAMQHAEYSPDNIGHYGLSIKSYCHFTSPIRRYSDLVIHRILKDILKKENSAYNKKKLNKIGSATTEQEKNIEAAEREVQSTLLCYFSKQFEGNKYKAIVNSVVNFGLFISVIDAPLQGLIHISVLGKDYFIYDEEKNILIGYNTKKVYKVGDILDVKLTKVIPKERKIDFTILK